MIAASVSVSPQKPCLGDSVMHRSALGSLHIRCYSSAWCFCRIPNSGCADGSLTLFPALVIPFILLDCFIDTHMRVCAQFYFILLCCIQLISLEGQLFCEGKQRSNRSWGLEDGRNKREDVVRIYYMREDFLKM